MHIRGGTVLKMRVDLVSSPYRDSLPALSYIGISKLPCKLCHFWISAYNKHTSADKYRTKGYNCSRAQTFSPRSVKNRSEKERLVYESRVQPFFIRAVQLLFCTSTLDPKVMSVQSLCQTKRDVNPRIMHELDVTRTPPEWISSTLTTNPPKSHNCQRPP